MEQPLGVNILVTGTPGTGKTSLCEMLVSELDGDFVHVEVGKVVKEQHFYTAVDPELDTCVIEEDDEDRLLDYMEPMMVHGGNHVVDYHSSELFPERWFQLVVVLHANTDVLYDRLSARRYGERKRGENMEAEIQRVCEDEARAAYKDSVLLVRDNNTLEEMAETVELIRSRVADLIAARGV